MPHDGRLVQTAIFKRPVEGPVQATKTGLIGDAQADLRYHGGADKAVYAFSHETYAHWRREL
ncbi:MAG: hypothetical protein KDA41_07370, partial [Planctomycetales bacterium]|nr:hypothetical protein [Planctomycetales bacterium]